MRDFICQDLNLDDHVIFVAPGYRSLVLGQIIKFTEKNVRISYMNTWNYSKPGRASELLQSPEQVIKIEGLALTEFLLKRSYE
jgi:hypothetical protein